MGMVSYTPSMRKNISMPLVLLFIAAFLDAQTSKTTLIYALNLGVSKVDVRLGEEKAPLYQQQAIQPLVPQPMTEIPSVRQVKLYARPSGAAAWEAVRDRSEGVWGEVALFDLAAGHVYCVVIYPTDEGLFVRMPDYSAEGNGPKIQLHNMANAPMQLGVGTDQGKWEGLEPPGYVGPGDISSFQALKTAGTFGIFFESFLWRDGRKVFYAAKEDPSKPAKVSFRDGAYYLVFASLDDSEKLRFDFYDIPIAKAGAAAAVPAASGVKASGAGTASSAAAQSAPPASVPASWNGEYAEERKPGRSALSVHDGKIWSVFGSSQTETFPGPSSLYRFVYGETECRSLEKGSGKEYERYLFDPKTGKLTYHMAGQAPTVYVPMKGK
jgi:hypothetical protein